MQLADMLQIFVTPPPLVSNQMLADQMGTTTQRMVPISDEQQNEDQARNTCFVISHVPIKTVENTVLKIDRKTTTSTSIEDRECDNFRGDTSRKYDSIATTSICNMVHEYHTHVCIF